jgi:ABC-2 type transport system permease protein
MLTRPMEIAASINPVTYIMEAMRSLIIDAKAQTVLVGFAVAGVLFVVSVALNVRAVRHYD